MFLWCEKLNLVCELAYIPIGPSGEDLAHVFGVGRMGEQVVGIIERDEAFGVAVQVLNNDRHSFFNGVNSKEHKGKIGLKSR